jgi:hypothetical protein
MARINVLGNRVWAMRQKDPNLSVREIAKKVGCTYSYAAKILYTRKHQYEAKQPATSLVIDMLEAKEEADQRLKAVWDEADKINRLNKEISELKAVVRYLEGKVGGLRGASI